MGACRRKGGSRGGGGGCNGAAVPTQRSSSRAGSANPESRRPPTSRHARDSRIVPSSPMTGSGAVRSSTTAQVPLERARLGLPLRSAAARYSATPCWKNCGVHSWLCCVYARRQSRSSTAVPGSTASVGHSIIAWDTVGAVKLTGHPDRPSSTGASQSAGRPGAGGAGA